MIAIIIIIIILFLASFIYYKYFKIPKMKSVVFIDGSLGTGKSALSVCLAVRVFKRNHRHWQYAKFLYKLFKIKRFANLEEPRLYSNIKLRYIDYVPVTSDLLQRKNFRFAYKSVLLLDEFSLIADQNMYGKRFEEICERMSEFFKLFRHETKGGTLICNSQSTSDLNWSLKSVISDYIYLHSKSSRFFPIITWMKAQECRFSRDNSSLQVNIDDIEDNLKTIVMLKKWYRYYDTYCHSIFTDSLPIYSKVLYHDKKDSLKTTDMVTYKPMTFLYENLKEENNNEQKDEKSQN